MKYPHLHRHDQFSLYDGFGTAESAAKYAVSIGMPALGLTNHGNVCGLIEHFNACNKHGVKPVLGLEAYLVARHPAKKRKNYHMTLLVQNEVGWKNLLLLADLSNQEKAFYYKPTVTLKMLCAHAEGLFAFTGCPAGPVARLITSDRFNKAVQVTERLKEAFGDRLYVEVQSNGYAEAPNEDLVRLAQRVGAPLVLTHDSHYIEREDYGAYAALGNLHRGADWAEGRENFWMPRTIDAWQMTKGLTIGKFGEALRGANDVAGRAVFNLRECKPRMPQVPNSDEILKRQCLCGLDERGLSDSSEYRQRLERELAVVTSIGMASYFCIVADIVGWAHRYHIKTGPGRGSVGGSLIAFSLGITDVDPIRYGIGFERFLREDKKTPPDIDLDFDSAFQDRVIAYAVEKYGARPIAAFGYYRQKNLENDLKKIFGPDWQDQKKAMRAYNVASGTVRYVGSHPGGVAIADQNDYWMLPRMYMHGKHTTQFDLYGVEGLGALKVDILGLDTVSLIGRLERTTKKRVVEPYDDEKVFEAIGTGECDGVFQLDSRGGQEVVAQVKPKNMDELAVCISLNRPAPLELGFVEKYIANDGRVFKGLRRYFQDTRGVPVYQDQVWRLCIEAGKMTRQEADKVLKVIKATTVEERFKMREEIDAIRLVFVEKMCGAGYFDEAQKASDFFDNVTGYGFNKAHAMAYAITSYITMWYRLYFPLQFAHAHLVLHERDHDRYKWERMADKMGIVLLPPHVNGSASYTIEDEAIRRGYMSVKGIGPAVAEKIAATAPYTGKTDFEERAHVNKGAWNALLQAGALEWNEDEIVHLASEYAWRLRRGA